MENQSKRIINWLNEGKEIDPITAWMDLGIYRLGARISELRKEGVPIDDKWIKITNRYGEEVRFKSFFLVVV
jgi:hypothetical protein